MSGSRLRAGARVLVLKMGPDVSETSVTGLLRRATAPLFEIERTLDRAARDPRLSAVVVHLDELDLGWAKAEAIHRALRAVRRSGKLTVSVATTLGNPSYLVASASELVLLQASSLLALQSLASESFFVKDLLGELGVRPQLDHVGEFKTAGEMFLRRSSSEEHRVEIDAILSELSGRFLSLVAEGRGLDRDTVARALAEGPLLPEEALERKLIDRMGGDDALEPLLEERLGSKIQRIPFRSYVPRTRWWTRLRRIRRKKVAVVHAVGFITMGEARIPRGNRRAVGARELAETLKKIRNDHRVGAVVVRVESPGGGAVASDWIRAELEAVAAAKPVVVSMGDVAASGGYLIATAAHSVLAEATTLTGSIGVIGGKLEIGQLLDRLGIHRETRSTGDNAGFFSPLRSFTPRERARHQELLEHFYRKRFLPAVAKGRNLTLAQADEAGRGRVWTGEQGLRLGLVDALGGLDDAVALACGKANLPRDRTTVDYVARRGRLRDLLMHGMGALERSPVTELFDAIGVARALAAEEVLCLMDRVLRIR